MLLATIFPAISLLTLNQSGCNYKITIALATLSQFFFAFNIAGAKESFIKKRSINFWNHFSTFLFLQCLIPSAPGFVLEAFMEVVAEQHGARKGGVSWRDLHFERVPLYNGQPRTAQYQSKLDPI